MPKTKKDSTKYLLTELDIKKEELIEEIKNDIKEDLFKDISKRVDYESKNKLDKMEKRIYRTKNFSILKRNIIILLLLVPLVIETKILYDNNLLFGLIKNKSNQVTQNNINDKENINKDEKDQKWYIEHYSYLLDNVKTNLDTENKYYLYENNYKTDKIDNKVKLNMSYQLLKNINNDNGVIRISDNDLKESYKKVFGNLDDYKPENFNNGCVQFVFNKQLQSFIAIDTECEKSDEQIFRDIKKIYEEDNKIVIEAYVGLYNKEKNKLRVIGNDKFYEYNENNIEKLNLYNFIFKQMENYYYLDEINKK